MKTITAILIISHWTIVFIGHWTLGAAQSLTGSVIIDALISLNETEALRLIECGADVNIRDKDEQSVMHYAGPLCYDKVIKKLIEKGHADQINSVDYLGDTPVHEVTRYGCVKNLELLIQNGGDVNKKTNSGSTPLYLAAIWGQEDVAKILIQNGADSNYTDENGLTALHFAAYSGHDKIVEQLLNSGADADVKNTVEQKPRDVAARNGNVRIVNLLDAAVRNLNKNKTHVMSLN